MYVYICSVQYIARIKSDEREWNFFFHLLNLIRFNLFNITLRTIVTSDVCERIRMSLFYFSLFFIFLFLSCNFSFLSITIVYVFISPLYLELFIFRGDQFELNMIVFMIILFISSKIEFS